MTAAETDHLSSFALDVYWASRRAADEAIDAHLELCARCRSYLESLDAVSAASPPASERASAEPRLTQQRPRSRGSWWVYATAASFALLGGIWLGSRTHELSSSNTNYVGIKGAPAVQLLVHRASDTHVWDGRSPVQPGDALALRVACDGFSKLAVAAPGSNGWKRLSQVACPSRDGALPFTLIVDEQPGDERFAVVLSRHSLDDVGLARAIVEKQQTSAAWVVEFDLPKEIER